MLIAEIRRKLADLEDLDPEEGDVVERVRAMLRETKEDLLTADVFGLLKYLPRVPYLQEVLQALADRNPACQDFRKSIQSLGRDIESCDFTFWPSYPSPKGLPGSMTEPDVQISTPNFFVFFEAKLYSGFGQYQIERELAAGLDQARGRDFFLVVVTPSILPPRIRLEKRRLSIPDYLNSAPRLPGISKNEANRIKANSHRVLWISWYAIMAALDSAYLKHSDSVEQSSAEALRVGDMIGDLNELMELRGLRPFGGFSHIMRTDISPRAGTQLMQGIPISPEFRFKGLTGDTLRRVEDFVHFSSRKSIVFHYSKKGRAKGLRVGALKALTTAIPLTGGLRIRFSRPLTPKTRRLGLSSVVKWFRPTNQEHVRFFVKSSGRTKRMMCLREIVQTRYIESSPVKLFPWRISP